MQLEKITTILDTTRNGPWPFHAIWQHVDDARLEKGAGVGSRDNNDSGKHWHGSKDGRGMHEDAPAVGRVREDSLHADSGRAPAV